MIAMTTSNTKPKVRHGSQTLGTTWLARHLAKTLTMWLAKQALGTDCSNVAGQALGTNSTIYNAHPRPTPTPPHSHRRYHDLCLACVGG